MADPTIDELRGLLANARGLAAALYRLSGYVSELDMDMKLPKGAIDPAKVAPVLNTLADRLESQAQLIADKEREIERWKAAFAECVASANLIRALTKRIPEDADKAVALICHMADRVDDAFARSALTNPETER